MTDYRIFAGRAPPTGSSATSTTIANQTVDPGTTGLRYGNLVFHGGGLTSDDFKQTADATLFQPKTAGVFEFRLFMGLPGGDPPDPQGYYLITLVQDNNKLKEMRQLTYSFVPDAGGVSNIVASFQSDPLLESSVHVEVQRSVSDVSTADVRMALTDMFQLDIVQVN
jgi:hypothetical protein